MKHKLCSMSYSKKIRADNGDDPIPPNGPPTIPNPSPRDAPPEQKGLRNEAQII
jgi:hypothetical protein